MSSIEETQPVDEDVFDHLTAARRRHVLASLVDNSAPVTEEALALDVLGRERDGSVEDVLDDDRREVRTSLRHRHLPILDEAGLVSWDRGHRTVTTADHAFLDDPKFRRLVELTDSGSDDLIACFADEHRRTAIDVLESRGEVDLSELVGEVARRGTDDGSAGRVDDLRIRFHHVHVPKLADAGVVDYHADENRVVFRGLPADVDRTCLP